MVSAQENNNRLRKKYRNLSFVKQEFEPASYFGMDQTLKSNFGAAFTVGRTFYLHKKPIAGLIRFGLDATWFDLNYTNYKLEYHWEDNYDEEEEPETSNFHQAEIGMQVGPSVTVNPVGKLNVNAYFRFAPSFSALYDDDTLLGNYASYFVTGGGISYGYQLYLFPHWNIEFSAGVGFLHFEYDKSAYPADKEPAYKYRNNYFGPTKLGVSIVYIIK